METESTYAPQETLPLNNLKARIEVLEEKLKEEAGTDADSFKRLNEYRKELQKLKAEEAELEKM